MGAEAAVVHSKRYRSPRNPERHVRAATSLIVLHTTEGAARGSLNKVCERGECHYCVTEDGTVYDIIDLNREAFHAGRSMWNAKEDCDKFSVGIEVVGHHDKPVTQAQIDALRELVAFLKGTYNLADHQVVCHSHVAYGAPNKWQRRNHRGRKRCGMLFAMPSVRAKLGLRAKPSFDPDVRAKRLVQADPYLAKVLYGNTDTMIGRIGPVAGGGFFSGITSWFTSQPARPAESVPSTVRISTDSRPAAKPAAAPAATKPAARKPVARTGTLKNAAKPSVPKTLADLKALKGYAQGVIGPGRSASSMAGGRWNAADTYYWTRKKVVRGNKVNAQSLEKGALIFYRK